MGQQSGPRRWCVLPLLALALAIAPLVGCQSYFREQVRRANAPKRAASLEPWRTATVDGEPICSYLLNRCALVFDGADSVEFVRVDGESGSRIAAVDSGLTRLITDVGSAVPITDDGYFMTAAHCVNEGHPLIVGAAPGSVAKQIVGTVVWDGSRASPPVDLAIVHAPGLRMPPARWSPIEAIADGAPVLCGGAGPVSLRVGGGTIVEREPFRPLDDDGPGVLAFLVAVPLVPGDSGGPTILGDGTLLGINVMAWIDEASPRGRVLRPDPAWIETAIADHRQRVAATSSPEPTISTAATVRLSLAAEEVQRALEGEPSSK